MNEKFLLFTWQPTWLLFQGDSCGFAGAENSGVITYEKENKWFKYLLSTGARLKHDRQWELLTVRALTGGDITLSVKDLIGSDEQAIKPISVVTANTEEILNKVFGAGEELIIKSASSPAAVMFLVREYAAHRRGN